MGGDDILQKNSTQKEIKQALNKALEQAPAAGETEEGAEETKVETPAEEPAATTSEAKPVMYVPTNEYYLKTLEEIPSGKLKGDLQVVYDRLSGVSGEVHTGNEFAKILKNSGLNPNFLKSLLNLDILESIEDDSENVGDTKGFDETTDEYMDRITRGARQDYQQSSPGSRFGGEDVFG
jgi:phosphomannomutase